MFCKLAILKMEFCDLTGDTDFDYFNPCFGKASTTSIQDPANNPRWLSQGSPLNFFHEENERLLFDIQLKKLRPLLSSVGGEDEKCYPTETCAGGREETSLSQEFPPHYPKLPVTDPFMFLKTRQTANKTATTRKNHTGTRTTGFFPSDENVIDNPTECCNHDEPVGNRRFLVNFDRSNTAADRSDVCYAAERDRCMQFWEFVNETPELLNVIKDGKFVHSVHPNAIECVFPEEKLEKEAVAAISTTSKKIFLPTSKMSKTKSKYTPEMRALRQRNERIHKDISNMRQRLHDKTTRLRKKSGELSISLLGRIRPPPPTGPPSLTTICGHYADCPHRNVYEVMAEMEQFDEIVQNPVRIPCDRRKDIGRPCPQEMDGFYSFMDEGYQEEETDEQEEGDEHEEYRFSYFGEKEEDSSSPQSPPLTSN